MAKFRKKPVVIDAKQFWPDKKPWPEGVDVRPGVVVVRDAERPLTDAWWIETLEGPFQVMPGDWIITGVKGERYPCKPDIFEATYDKAEVLTHGR